MPLNLLNGLENRLDERTNIFDKRSTNFDENSPKRCNCLIMKMSDLTNAILFRILVLEFFEKLNTMATLLTKDVTREAYLASDLQGRKLIITLKAGDMLSIRPKGRRVTYEVPLAACYNLALIHSANEWYCERMKTYEEKRKAGYRVRKPRRLPAIFSRKFYEALK